MDSTTLITGAAGVCALGVVALLFRASPRFAFALWAATVFFVPVWVGVSVGSFFLSAVVAVTLLVIVTVGKSVKLAPADGVVAIFVVLVVGLWLLKLVTLSHMVIAVLEWAVPYVWGRMAYARVGAQFISKTIAALAVAAAALAVVEFSTGTNLFLLLPVHGGPFTEWGTLQYRGGLLRAEGAFGHSIALGAALSMSAPFLLATTWRAPLKLGGLAIIIAGTVVTFSRIGLVSLIIAVVLSIVIMPGLTLGARMWMLVGGATAAGLAVPFVLDVIFAAGDEAAGSADYRSDMLSLLPILRPLGSPGDWTTQMVEGTYLGYFANSIDNAILVNALRFGYVPALLVLAGAVAIGVVAVRRSTSSSPAIAVACQLPALVSVALITQYGSLLWFFAGVVVAGLAARRSPTVETVGMTHDVDAIRNELYHDNRGEVRHKGAEHPE